MSEMTKNMGTKGMLVYNRLKTDILDNKYPPGTDMVERKLCDIYEVSRSTIRHALSALCAEGILENKQGKGIAVPNRHTGNIERCSKNLIISHFSVLLFFKFSMQTV